MRVWYTALKHNIMQPDVTSEDKIATSRNVLLADVATVLRLALTLLGEAEVLAILVGVEELQRSGIYCYNFDSETKVSIDSSRWYVCGLCTSAVHGRMELSVALAGCGFLFCHEVQRNFLGIHDEHLKCCGVDV